MGYTERTTSRSDAVERLHDQLQDSLRELVTSEDWQRALAVAARFHDYSFANTRLIWAQSLARGFTPTRVAGYHAWQELGRHVKRGERGLQILAPVTRKVTPEGGEEEERRVVGFRIVHVFDLAQTDGEPLPEIRAELLEGDLPTHWQQVTELFVEAGFAFEVADLDRLGEANGVTDWARKEVVVRASLPGAQRFKTAVHELVHTRLHEPTSQDRPHCRGIVEVEAESVAYMVCTALGIDSAKYSLPYVASWSGGDLTKVTATAGRVIGCARTVLAELERDRGLEHERVARSPRAVTPSRETAEAASPRSTRRRDLEEVLEAATELYRDQLRAPAGTQALERLRARGISEDAIEIWQLGYAPDSWRALNIALRQCGFTDDLLLEAGVVGRSRDGRLFDRMRGRIIFPIHNQEGRPRGLAGRLLAGHGPKYLNTPETDLYQKRSLLYGLHLAHERIAESQKAIVVEGYTDAIAAHQAGFSNVVATAGTALTRRHIERLGRIAAEVTLTFDGDRAGLSAAERAADLDHANHGIRLSVAKLPAGLDPADLLARDTHAFEQAVAKSIPIEHHLIDQIVEAHNLEEPEAMARVIRAAGEVIRSTTNPDIRQAATTHLAARIGRDQALVHMYLDPGFQRPALQRDRGKSRSIA